ncbi:MAG TPA: hypothetical protein VF796_26525 [Humisphaera sp.]
MTDKTPKPSSPSAPAAAQPQPAPTRTLSLVKGDHRFCFAYAVGEEPAVLDALVDMVHKRELPFDWFDAAVLSHQLGQHLAKELMQYLPKKAA